VDYYEATNHIPPYANATYYPGGAEGRRRLFPGSARIMRNSSGIEHAFALAEP